MTDEELAIEIQHGHSEFESVLIRQLGCRGYIKTSVCAPGDQFAGYAVSYSGYILKTAARYGKFVSRFSGVDFEDVLQACAVGVIKAARKYKHSDMLFKNFAIWYMKKEIYSLLGLRDGIINKLESFTVFESLEAPADGEDGAALEEVFHDDRLRSVFDDPEEYIVNEDMKAIVRSAVRQLAPDERESIEKNIPGAVRLRAYRKLRKNKKLNKLWSDYFESAYSGHVGIDSFMRSRESEVERAVFQRELKRNRIEFLIAVGILKEENERRKKRVAAATVDQDKK